MKHFQFPCPLLRRQESGFGVTRNYGVRRERYFLTDWGIRDFDLRGHSVVEYHIHPSPVYFRNGSTPFVDTAKVMV